MNHRRITLVLLAVFLGSAAAGFGFWQRQSVGVSMTTAAEAYIKSLTPDQRALAMMPYEAKERTEWHYIPKATRKGLQLKDMTETQRDFAHTLLQAALSAAGYQKATKIMQLETLLADLEKDRRGAPLRDSQRYFFTVFGTPNATGRWGLSVEGHHLSLNFVVDQNQMLSSTPTFFGANPAIIQADYGDQFKKGTRVLAREEDLAYQLLASLTSEQRKAAVIAEKAPNDVRGAMSLAPPHSPAAGLAAGELTSQQQTILKSLVEEYARNVPEDVATQRMSAIEREGFGGLKFAWSGSDKAGEGHDYRIQGTTFLIEFNNTQPDSAGNLANHIHSVWHNLSGNFALPVGGAQ